MQITSRAVFAESTTATTYHKSKLQISKPKKNFSLISQPLILPNNFTTETSHSTNKKKKGKNGTNLLLFSIPVRNRPQGSMCKYLRINQSDEKGGNGCSRRSRNEGPLLVASLYTREGRYAAAFRARFSSHGGYTEKGEEGAVHGGGKERARESR